MKKEITREGKRKVFDEKESCLTTSTKKRAGKKDFWEKLQERGTDRGRKKRKSLTV
jgi:hypothetical protein